MLLTVLCFTLGFCGKNQSTSKDELNIEQKIKRLKEKIQKIAERIETNPEAEKVDEWRDLHREYNNELEKLKLGEKLDIQGREETEFPELEAAIMKAEEQFHKIEVQFEELKEKEGAQDNINEVKERLEKKRNELAELKTLLKKRKKGEDTPSAYLREKGEVTGNVISATDIHLTVQLKDSGRVMVFYVTSHRRVEGQRVPNTELIEYVKKLKKGQMMLKWALDVPGVTAVVPMITNFKHLEEDIAVGFDTMELSSFETQANRSSLQGFAEKMSENYCRSCGQCMSVCKLQIAVPEIFRYELYYSGYGKTDQAKQLYRKLPSFQTGDHCDSCGKCEKACPFSLPILTKLREAHILFS